MSKTIKEERLRWVKPIAHKEIRIVDAVKVCPYSKRSLERWLEMFRKYGEEELEPKSTKPKTNPHETPIRLKERIIEIRKEKRKCALKIKWELEKEGIYIHKNTIHKVIKNEGLTRRYRTRKIRYKYIKVPLKQGELVEIDVKYVPSLIENKQYYQYTAIDVAGRWRHLEVYEEQSNYRSIKFLLEVLKRAPFRIRAIKTDNHSIFTNRYTGYEKSTDPLNPRLHIIDQVCAKHNIIHYLIDPGKPQQNSIVERSHRSDQESFYDMIKCRNAEELKYKIRLWNMYYNDLEHCGLDGKSPNEFLKLST